MTKWYASKTTNQGMVVDESSGRTIAVTYDPRHAVLVAAAPTLLETLEWIALRLKRGGRAAQQDAMDQANFVACALRVDLDQEDQL